MPVDDRPRSKSPISSRDRDERRRRSRSRDRKKTVDGKDMYELCHVTTVFTSLTCCGLTGLQCFDAVDWTTVCEKYYHNGVLG